MPKPETGKERVLQLFGTKQLSEGLLDGLPETVKDQKKPAAIRLSLQSSFRFKLIGGVGPE